MSTINELKWSYLTALVNEIKGPNTLLGGFFGNHVALPTEDIEIDTVTGGREIAPFVRRDGAAVMVSGLGSTFATVKAPNIRIKRAFTPTPLLFGRQPATTIFQSSASGIMSAVQAHIARDMTKMNNMIANAEEYLSAMALQGAISYSVTDQEVFTVTFPRNSDHNITLSTFWNDGTPANVLFHEDIYRVKRLINEATGLSVTDAICGTEAAATFRKLVAGGHITSLDLRNVAMGSVTFNEQYRDNGALYMGTVDGINFWEYGRAADLNGVSTAMVRAKYVEFIANSPAAERTMYYGAIPDMDAFQGNLFQAEKFSKSWMEKDPSVQIALIHSRPLPVPRRPDATVSMKVVSG